jgi:hypothetical protein
MYDGDGDLCCMDIFNCVPGIQYDREPKSVVFAEMTPLLSDSIIQGSE